MASFVYGNFAGNALGGHTGAEAHAIDYISDDIRVLLLKPTYLANETARDTHEFYSDVVGFEISGAGYTASGLSLSGKSITYEAGDNIQKFLAADPEWVSSTFTARYAVVLHWNTGVLIACHDFGEDKHPSGVTFKVQWGNGGPFLHKST